MRRKALQEGLTLKLAANAHETKRGPMPLTNAGEGQIGVSKKKRAAKADQDNDRSCEVHNLA
jgi:hypothetical protein